LDTCGENVSQPVNTNSLDTTPSERIFTGYASDQTDDSDNTDDNTNGANEDTDNDVDHKGNQADDEDDSGPSNHGPTDDSDRSLSPATAVTLDHTSILVTDTIPAREISALGAAKRRHHNMAIANSIPQPKRRKLEIPARTRRQGEKNRLFFNRIEALQKIEKLLDKKQCPFEGGHNGLQACRARAIRGYLHMLARNDRQKIEASERAAESQGFAAKWGGRQVRAWTELWLNQGKLPASRKGKHIKVFTLLEEPDIRAELRSYVRSNKWAVDPVKLANFTAQTMIPTVAKAYGAHLAKDEIPKGLKQYLELELFPRTHMKAKRGVSINTARRWLHREGFRFTEHRKALYFDGHEREDVVEYRQKTFLPQMKQHRLRIVEYVVGDVAKEKIKQVGNCIERCLVLVSHDESTTQANDGKKKSWVHENEHALKKKGLGRGIHQSDVICSTVGWLKEASQSLEYGKNYEGYWNGELFVKQVSERSFEFTFLTVSRNLSYRKRSFRHSSRPTVLDTRHSL
jgi:hypothetical protein